MVSVFTFLIHKKRKLVKRNSKFKNIHNGERCFILGTGPSLKDVNPEYLKNEIIFGVNFLQRSDFMKYITPTYYCLYDNIFHTTAKESTKEIIEQFPNTTFFLRTNAFDAVKEFNIKNNNIYYQYCNLYQYDNYINVDMANNMTAPFNVVLGCIQTAIYMGFKEIYLLGCDFNSFASLKVEHCYDKDNAPDRQMSIGFELKFYSMVSYHHYALSKYAKENKIRIINLTPNSLLDAYERRDLEDIIC
jgi:hypothetical protein